jgi:AcrR family transcriptional regulator
MSNRTSDLRYLKTQQQILTAMITLLQRQSFEKITVRDICQQAQVSRSGFYLHYDDKYDLVKKYQLTLTTKGNQLFQTYRHQDQQTLLRTLLEFLQHDGQLLALLLSQNGSAEIQTQIKQFMRDNARHNILPYLKLKITNEMEANYCIVFLSNAIFGVIQEWVNTQQQESPAEIAAVVARLLAGLLA